jgi:hypothetical protein
MARASFILVLDYHNRGFRFGAVGAARSRWLEKVAPTAGSFRPLAAAFKEFGLPRQRPSVIVVALGDRSAGAEHVSWSTVRAAIATANTLAFAWQVPCVAARVRGTETTDELAVLARQVAVKAPVGNWVQAAYDGEPHITMAKPKL